MYRLLLVNQEEGHLLPGELSTLYHDLGNPETIDFIPTAPKDSKEHAEDCYRYQPTLVLLPYSFDKNIPSEAMEHGHRHIVVAAQGIMEVKSLKPPVLQLFKM